MAYQTGTFSTLEQLLDALRVFAEANGWTTDTFANFRGGKWLGHHNADGVYLHWYSANNVPINPYSDNGKYAGNNLTRIVLHPATGYTPSVHPAWQPGVAVTASGSVYYSATAGRQTLNSGRINTSGQYHFVAASGLLAVVIDCGYQRPGYFVVQKATLFSGGEVQYFINAGGGAGYINDEIASLPMVNLYSNDDNYFYNTDYFALFSGGAWNKKYRNLESNYPGSPSSPYISGSTNRSSNDLWSLTQPSGVTGGRPLYRPILFKRVSNILRFDSFLPHVAMINPIGMAIGQEIQTTSGAWRVFPFDGIGLAIRSDL